MTYSREELREIEKQLSCPTGDFGIEMGKGMHETNLGMISNSIDFLDLKEGQQVLELGHGSCRHLDLILGAAKNIQYFGLEVSHTMKNEAKKTEPELECYIPAL